MKPINAVLIGCGATLYSFLAFAETQTNDANLAWGSGAAYIPGNFLTRSPDRVNLDRKMPVVILMHGCTGITTEIQQWAAFIKELGFVVITPNSFARKNRFRNCNSETKTTGGFPAAQQYRQEEIAYALTALKGSEWVDSEKIYLMGHSEGGTAVAMSSQSDFKGRIVTGSSCGLGFNGPRSSPVLVIVYLQDQWY
jgi:poly(3-hydroxybutyrate) depolymerase